MVIQARIWQAKVVQTCKPGKHTVRPQPEYVDLFSMLRRYASQVSGTKRAGSGSWRAVTAGGLTRTSGSGEPT
eukprot:1158165-Pelagomonas_calceolata.AAC.7